MIPLDMDVFLLYMVYHSRQTFNISLSAAHYDTNHVHWDTKIEGCDAHACWKQHKTINYGNQAVHTLLITRSFQLYLPFLRGDP